jgi:hypothetical protein
MKTRNSFVIMTGLSLMLTAGVAKAASESPIKCKLEQGNIKCTVVSDNVEITNVILNRGRCAAPEAATQKDIEDLKEFKNKLQPRVREYYFSSDGRPDPFVVLKSHNVKKELFDLYSEPYWRVASDPRGKYGFGDTVQIPARLCNNLIEFTIEANGQNWTWKTN